MPAVPFGATLVQLIEARIRVEDVNAQKAAATLTQVHGRSRALKTRLEAGIAGGSAADALRLNKDEAALGAQATRRSAPALTEWFSFYNGYDPMFTWWMGMPFKQVDAALQDYATFLRDKVAAADAQVRGDAGERAAVAPAPAPKFASVPDLAEIIALPQDEMRDIVARFNARRPGGGRGGRGGRRGGGSDAGAGAARHDAFYTAWLAALKTLDFDALSRNAQVDYLYIKRTRRTGDRARRHDDSARTAAQGRQRRTSAARPRGRAGPHPRPAATT